MSNSPWYADGLRFECTGCGDCCTGDPGYVWVNKAEIAAIAKLVGIEDIAEFERRHVHKVGIRKSLDEHENGDCHFFDPEKRSCQVYEARPRQCRTWPFWNSTVRTLSDWEQTCEECPGSGKGQLYQLEQIEEQRRQIRV